MVNPKLKEAEGAANRGTAPGRRSESRLSSRVIKGDLHANIWVRRGMVDVWGDLRGCIIGLTPEKHPGSDVVRLRRGEELIVQGTVHGDIRTEGSSIHIGGDVLGYVSPSLRRSRGICVDGAIGGPSSFFVSPRSVARRGQIEDAIRSYLREREGKVTVRPLLSSSEIECNYGTYAIVSDGKTFRKLVPGAGETKPSAAELRRFRSDVDRASKADILIADFINSNPSVLED